MEFSIEEIDAIAKKIIDKNPHKIILFDGVMGAGKTTLIKAIAKQLKVINSVNSPTFSLVNEYKTVENKPVFHFDFYRLKNESEALDIGVEEYFYSGNWCLIEWSEKIPNLIPETNTKIEISILSNEKRKLTFK